MDSELIYREWLEDELVVVSNVPIPKILKTEELYDFDWICRDEGSHTRRVVQEVFDELGVSCKSFNVLSEVSNTTTVLQTLKKSDRNPERPVVSILSKHAIMDAMSLAFESSGVIPTPVISLGSGMSCELVMPARR